MSIKLWIGCIPGLEIDRTFFHERLFYFKTDSFNYADSGDIKIRVQFDFGILRDFSENA